MSHHQYVDRDGNPITMIKWGQLFEQNDYRRVALDTIENYEISTVWLGLNHGHGEHPLYFETMVFDASAPHGTLPPWPDDYEPPEVTRWQDLDARRYRTETEAVAGHQEMVEKVKAKVALLRAATEGMQHAENQD